jgi:hypothetical protein
MAMKPVDGSVASSARTLSSPVRDHPAIRESAIESHETLGKTPEETGVADPAPAAVFGCGVQARTDTRRRRTQNDTP